MAASTPSFLKLHSDTTLHSKTQFARGVNQSGLYHHATAASLSMYDKQRPHCAMLCNAMLRCAMLCHAMPCYAVLCHAMLCCAMLCYAVPCHTMLQLDKSLSEHRSSAAERCSSADVSTHFPVSMSVWNRLWPPSGLSMFILRSRFISMSLLGVNDALPLGGVTSKETPVLCKVQHI